MKNEFVPYEEALALKELGFDEPCWAWWHIEDCDTRFCYSEERSPITNSQEDWWAKQENRDVEIIGLPLYQQAFRWFREKYDLPSHIAIYWQHDWNNYSYEWNIVKNHQQWNVIEHFKTYKEAELACLKKLIEIVNEQNK